MSEGWSGGAKSIIWIFVPYVTQGNEQAGSVQTFPFFSLFQEPPPFQKFWKKSSKSMPTKVLRTWTSVSSPKTRHQPQHPLKTTGYINKSNHSTRTTPFLRTTQLQTLTIYKRRIQLLNHNFKFHQPNIYELTTTRTRHSLPHCNVKAPFKSKSTKTIAQTNQKIISTTSHITLSLTPPTLQRPPQQTHMPLFISPTIFPRTVVELLGIIN